MKGTRISIGVISIILFVIISLQSCVVGVGNALTENGETSGTGGIVLAFLMLIAGIVGISTKSSKVGGYISGAIYILSALAGFVTGGTFSDLKVWSWIAMIFGVLVILTSLLHNRNKSSNAEITS